MTMPVSYVEINSSDAEQSRQFLAEVFGWEFQPFARSDYLVAPAGVA
jgi:predicted enzyme related to lactoylglutathione lyase